MPAIRTKRGVATDKGDMGSNSPIWCGLISVPYKWDRASSVNDGERSGLAMDLGRWVTRLMDNRPLQQLHTAENTPDAYCTSRKGQVAMYDDGRRRMSSSEVPYIH